MGKMIEQEQVEELLEDNHALYEQMVIWRTVAACGLLLAAVNGLLVLALK